jgi:2-succinyl-6-hydroxy-2,4-cyclohexadiene-1-carboxylate synthase
MALAFELRGQGPRLAMVHGFAQNRLCWGKLVDDLATDHELVLLDAPGHGESQHDDADLWESAQLLADIAGPAHYFGYSMGGRMLVHLALANPELVQSLTTIGATAGTEDQSDRSERIAADEEIALRLLSDGLADFLHGWEELPMFGDLTDEMWGRNERLTNRAAGLAASLRRCGSGRQEPLWDRLDQLSMPCQFLAGEDDQKFRDLAERMASHSNRLPSETAAVATAPVILGARHAAHLVNPVAVAQQIRRFTQL